MKFVVGGREIQAVSLQGAQLIHLMELKVQTREWSEDGKGYSAKDLERLDGDEHPELYMAVMLFLSRRATGEKVTFNQAASVAMADVQVVKEPGDEPAPVADVPTVPDGPEISGLSGENVSSDGTADSLSMT